MDKAVDDTISLLAPFRAAPIPYANHGEWQVVDITGTEVNLTDRRHAQLVSASLNSYAGCADPDTAFRLTLASTSPVVCKTLGQVIDRLLSRIIGVGGPYMIEELRGDIWVPIASSFSE